MSDQTHWGFPDFPNVFPAAGNNGWWVAFWLLTQQMRLEGKLKKIKE